MRNLNPPLTEDGRALEWSGVGAGRVPELGEGVRLESQAEYMPFGKVVDYFEAHGYLGVIVRMASQEEVAAFGSEIDVSPGGPPPNGSIQ